ncbi:hypothetical protein [Synechococcus sp. MVIR-18-1]|uniref:hypothetical protein n=1 Tax=Synechococcus sp. MVIR-18-1 TaxID=1386941 RepID=UPI001644DD55|nr:hypothetical protein [Synechococcus sp. MVIR-18-1]
MPQPVQDLVGKNFGRLTVDSHAGRMNGKNFWFCVCECGTWALVDTTKLKSGKKKSCGCLKKDTGRLLGKSQLRHGGCSNGESIEFRTWATIKARHEMVEEWNDFQQFFKDVGWKPSEQHQIARRDVRKAHSPTNTYWRDPIEREQRRHLTKEDLGNECFIDMRTFCLAT